LWTFYQDILNRKDCDTNCDVVVNDSVPEEAGRAERLVHVFVVLKKSKV
jgi:hypothetical protein